MNSKFLTFVLKFCILAILYRLSASEVFKSTIDLNNLPAYEGRIIDRIQKVKKHVDFEIYRSRFETLRKQSRENIDDFKPEVNFHPVDSYHRFRRLAELSNMVEVLEKEAGLKTRIISRSVDHELNGAIKTLVRLQQVYRFPIEDLVNGTITITNTQTGSEQTFTSRPLNANDCLRMATYAFDVLYLNESTILWAEQAIRLANEGAVDTQDFTGSGIPNDAKKITVEALQLLSFASIGEGFYSEALSAFSRALELAPGIDLFKFGEMLVLETWMNQAEVKSRPADYGRRTDKPAMVSDVTFNEKAEVTEIYEALCRGEQYLTPANISSLHCFYLDTSGIDPFYKLWKIQVEEAGKYPHIVQFHDVISDDEIEYLKLYAKSKLKTAKVDVGNEKVVGEERMSKSAWAWDLSDPLFEQLSMRVSALTGLNVLDSGEALQIGNYGLGGFYSPHYDSLGDDTPPEMIFPTLGTGNRIATWMFYLSEVTAGGATVFPSTGVRILPRKGSAAFWYNLRSSGNNDVLTVHAGCPVVIGSKWVANKWIHEHEQEFRKPCHTEPYQLLMVNNGKY